MFLHFFSKINTIIYESKSLSTYIQKSSDKRKTQKVTGVYKKCVNNSVDYFNSSIGGEQ